MTTAAEIAHLQEHGLYAKSNEHDACGLGFVAHIKGEKRHDIVLGALKILENIDHRGAVGADPGDVFWFGGADAGAALPGLAAGDHRVRARGGDAARRAGDENPHRHAGARRGDQCADGFRLGR